MDHIRNFCIIAHIDHGKSTLADRLLEFTKTIQVTEGQMLDDMELERERGITIKSHAIQMEYTYQGEKYILNLIDTPGHVDFSYEVSRSIAACEGALLVVDATQGVQAQTISNLYMAIDHDLEIIPVINKIDMPSAMPDEVEDEIIDLIGCDRSDIIRASGKTGEGVEDILNAVVERIPHPEGDEHAPLQALIFDSVFNSFRGIIAYFKIVNGSIHAGDHVKFFNTGMEYDADEIGVLKMDMIPRKELRTGDVGYIISGIKNSKEVKVGDTITQVANPCSSAIEGFQEVKPMVFAGVYPIDPTDYENLRASLEKLQLNDASLTFTPESSVALGFGFRCGFLGLLHMEIVQERLDREFDMDVITTVPNVSYMCYTKQGEVKEVHNPSGLPDLTMIEHIEEPYIRASIITAADYIGPIMTLCLDKRGELIDQQYVSGNRVELHFHLPLGEIVIDFYDKLKSISKGYASFDYHIDGFRPSKLAKLDILLNGEPVDALSTLTHQDNAVTFETVKQVRKDVTAKCYGGDVSRKRKLLEKQKRGKKRMKQIGNVEVPQKAFLAVLNELDMLESILVPMKFAKNEFILREGEICTNIYWIVKGLVRQFYFKNDKELTEYMATENNIVMCIESLFREQPTKLQIKALEPTILIALPKADLEAVAMKSVNIQILYRKILEESLILSQHHADMLRFESAQDRYQKLVKNQPQLVLRAPLVYIASYLQMTPETLSRVRTATLLEG